MPNSDTRRAIAVQGLGAGAITSSVQIMLSDLVTLRERGTFSGLMALLVPILRFVHSKPAHGSCTALGQSAAALVQSLEDHWLRAGIGMPYFPSWLFPPVTAVSHRTHFSLQEVAVLYVLLVFFRCAACRESSSDLNLPICVFNATLVLLFMRLKTPPATLSEKLSKIDFM